MWWRDRLRHYIAICQFMLSICHAEVFFLFASPGKSSHNLFLAYFQLLYTVVTRLDFKKFIGSGCKVVPLPQKDEAEGHGEHVGVSCLGGTARSPSIPLPILVFLNAPSPALGIAFWNSQ